MRQLTDNYPIKGERYQFRLMLKVFLQLLEKIKYRLASNVRF